jgi:hypothetical protein
MIFRTVQRQRDSSQLSNGSANVIIKADFVVGSYQRAPIAGRKDNVVKEICVGVAHDSSLSRLSRQIFIKGYRPLRGLTIRWASIPGVRCAHPGLYAAVRSADLFGDPYNSSDIKLTHCLRGASLTSPAFGP